MSKTLSTLLCRTILLCLAVPVLSGCQGQGENSAKSENGNGPSAPIIMQAAASTQDALNEIISLYSTTHPTQVQINYASSGTLAQQILQGAPADLFLSANADWVDRLEAKDLISQRSDLLSNQLVLIVPKDSELELQSLEELRDAPLEFFALADPESVPAGIYGKQVLEKLNLWEPFEERVVRGADVRQTLMFVERAEADCGIVYATDAAASKRVRVLLKIDAQLYEQIIYPLALVKQEPSRKEAQNFYNFLSSPAAIEVFQKYGFQPLHINSEAE